MRGTADGLLQSYLAEIWWKGLNGGDTFGRILKVLRDRFPLESNI